MEIQHAHSPLETSRAWIQVVNGHVSIAWVAGNLLNVMETPPTGVAAGTAYRQSPATANLQHAYAVAIRNAPANDFNQMQLAQVYGYHAAVKFNPAGNAVLGKLIPSAIVGGVESITVATPTVQQLAAMIGYCMDAATTPTSCRAILQCC